MFAVRTGYIAVALTLALGTARAEDKKPPSALPGIQADGFAVLSVNVARLWDAKEAKPFHAGMVKIKARLAKEIEDEYGIAIEDIERVTYYWAALDGGDGEPEPFRFVTARKPFDRAKLIGKFQAQSADQITNPKFKEKVAGLAGKNVYFTYARALIFADERTLIVSPYIGSADVGVAAFLKVLAGTTAKVDKGPLAEALAGFEKHDVVAAIDLSGVRTILNDDPAPKGFESLVALAQGERASFTFDFGPTVRAGMMVTFFDNETAEKVEPRAKECIGLALKHLEALRKAERRDPETEAVSLPWFNFAKAALDKAELKRDGKTLTAVVGGEIAEAAKKTLTALPPWVDATADRLKSSDNLASIIIGLHTFNDETEALPQDVTDKDGKAILSWRVHVLKHCDEALYKKIDLTKAWDDPVNKKFAERTPDVFKYFGRGPEEKGSTYFQMLTSPEPLEGGSPVLVTGRKISLIKLTDGTSNTLMVAEGATAVNWLKPGDIPYDPKKRPKLGDPKTGKFLAGMGDGRVRRIDYEKLSDETLHNLIRIDDGNPLGDDFD